MFSFSPNVHSIHIYAKMRSLSLKVDFLLKALTDMILIVH